jgi:hypothetical protein
MPRACTRTRARVILPPARPPGREPRNHAVVYLGASATLDDPVFNRNQRGSADASFRREIKLGRGARCFPQRFICV